MFVQLGSLALIGDQMTDGLADVIKDSGIRNVIEKKDADISHAICLKCPRVEKFI
jgi:hypothetical protein